MKERESYSEMAREKSGKQPDTTVKRRYRVNAGYAAKARLNTLPSNSQFMSEDERSCKRSKSTGIPHTRVGNRELYT